MERLSQRVVVWLPWVALMLLGLWMMNDLLMMLREDAAAGLRPLEQVVNFALRLAPTALLLFALGVVIEVLEEEYQSGRMSVLGRRLLFWTPRIATLLFVGLVSLFALDVFGEGHAFWGTLLALFLHLIPSLLLLAAAAVAWRWPWVGALAMIGWAVWYLVVAWGEFPISVYLFLAGLPSVLGVLFLLNWQYRGELRQGV